MMKSLTHFLLAIPDPRRKQGQRIDLPSFLSMVILGNMSGFTSLQSLSRFFKNNRDYFENKFNLIHGVPGYTRTRTLLEQIDFEALNEAFTNWSMQFIETDDWISMDGKCIGSTITNYLDSYQNFHSIVSAFCRSKGINLTSGHYENKKESELNSVLELIELFENKGVVITLDALHCQKKRSKPSWSLEMTM